MSELSKSRLIALAEAKLTTASRLVDFLEDDGYKIDLAAWVVDEDGNGFRANKAPRS